MSRNGENNGNEKVRKVAMWIAVAGAAILALGYLYLILNNIDFEIVKMELSKQTAVALVLPFAGFIAFLLVTLLRIGSGPIEFKALGFDFKGSSGPAILWILCFLAIVSAVKMLWQ